MDPQVKHEIPDGSRAVPPGGETEAMPVDVDVPLPDSWAAACEPSLMEPHVLADQLCVRPERRALQCDRDPDSSAGGHVSRIRAGDAQRRRLRESQGHRSKERRQKDHRVVTRVLSEELCPPHLAYGRA